jgi:replicative DNA helicase
MRLREAGWIEGVGGPGFLAGLSEQVGFAINAVHYAKIVKKYSKLRRLLDLSQKVASSCLDKVDDIDALLGETEESICEIRDDRQESEVFLVDDLTGPEISRIEAIYEGKKDLTGVPSGFIMIDRLTGGWQNSDLIILAARPSMGKTAMAMNIADHAASKAGVPTAFFTLEQPKEQLAQRLLSSRSRINATSLRHARLTSDQWSRLYEVGPMWDQVPLYIIDRPAMSPLEIRAHARRLKNRAGLGLVVIDYLQLVVDQKSRSREREVSQVSRAAKSLAKELNIPVIALAQLSRECEKRPNKRPQLSDLRESGAIEQDADLVMFIYRDEVYRENSPDAGKAEIKLAKHRNGPTGIVTLTYLAETMTFRNYLEGAE